MSLAVLLQELSEQVMTPMRSDGVEAFGTSFRILEFSWALTGVIEQICIYRSEYLLERTLMCKESHWIFLLRDLVHTSTHVYHLNVDLHRSFSNRTFA